jgi:hypothetical protein
LEHYSNVNSQLNPLPFGIPTSKQIWRLVALAPSLPISIVDCEQKFAKARRFIKRPDMRQVGTDPVQLRLREQAYGYDPLLRHRATNAHKCLLCLAFRRRAEQTDDFADPRTGWPAGRR